MSNRTFGWIQDGGSFENLKRVLMAITPHSDYNRLLRLEMIPTYVPERCGRDALIEAIDIENCSAISYELLVGKGSALQLTVDENMRLFGYNEQQAIAIVDKGGRGNAACSGIAQIATPAQKVLPNGQKKPYQGNWSADSFVRWGISLGFIDYDDNNDTCKISELGLRFANSESNSENEANIIGEALLSYSPACRVLELLNQQGHLTKFDIGKQLGFTGEAGFTSVSQSMYVGGYCTAQTPTEKREIRQNYEGSSDKYARMIAGWLSQIGWVAIVPKNVTEAYLGNEYTLRIGQSYMLTQKGQQNLNRIRGGSRHSRSKKRIFWNMLATAAPDSEYLRKRRYYILQAIKQYRTLEEVQQYLVNEGLEVGIATISDDLNNFINIGLDVTESNNRYLLRDEIICLKIPSNSSGIVQSDISVVKDAVREKLSSVNHRYLVLLDLAYTSDKNREFEIETMSLMTEELAYDGVHLGGSRRPDGLFYKDTKGVIVDTKAYSDGYNLPIAQADEMIRYIEENKARGNINTNQWWENFSTETTDFSFLFVSSEFKGHYIDNIQYINNRTNYDGSVITAENLLLFAEKVLSGQLSYNDSFDVLRINDEVNITI